MSGKMINKLGTLLLSVIMAFGMFGCANTQPMRTGAKEEQNMQTVKHKTATEEEFEYYIREGRNFPVSFVYGGTSYHGFKGFSRTAFNEKTENGKRSVTLEFLHPDKKLQATVEAAMYPDHDAYEWTVYFSNVSKDNTSILSDVVAAELSFTGDRPVVKSNVGDYGGHFMPYEKALADGDVVVDATTGRSCEEYMPYFNLETDDGGAMIAIGWPGTWRAEFFRRGGKTLFNGTGTTGLRTYLKPDECVQTPLMAFVRYYRRDEDEATNKWRRWYIDHNLPYEDGAHTRKIQPSVTVGFVSDTPVGWYRGGSEFENSTTYRASIDAVKAHELSFDYHWFDAGWYTAPNGDSLPDSWSSVGSWNLDRTKWPGETFKDYTTAMKEELGVKGSTMWFEVERFNGLASDIYTHFGLYPKWLLPAQGEHYLVWHGDPNAVDWLFGRITSTMELAGIHIYREDHNFSPVTAFRAGDALQGENRNGITENLHFRGKFELWDRILEWQAETGRAGFIEMQSAGGNRQDLALLRRAVSFFRSDSDIVLDPPATVSKVTALNKWIPYGGVLFGRISETDGPNPRDMYQWRSTYSSTLCVPMQFQNLTDETWDLIERGMDEFEKYRQYVFYDMYELTEPKPLYDSEQWVARMYFDKESDKGVMEVFNFPKSKTTMQKIYVRGLDPDGWYSLTDPDGRNGIKRIKGSELMSGYDVYLQPRSSAILWIDPIER